MLNIIANKLQIEGQEYATSNQYGIIHYFTKFVDECSYTLGEDEDGRQIGRLPQRSRYIKSEDILYEINGETALQMLDDYIESDALYLLDEPEVSLSPVNQTLLAEKINEMTRLLECQFIVSTHSPFMLGTLNAKIYNLDSRELEVTKWADLENVRYFYDFFERHRKEFE